MGVGMSTRRAQTMTFVEEEPPVPDPVDHMPKCPQCGNPLDERHYPHLPDPKSYYDCPRCHLTWEGFLTAPAPAPAAKEYRVPDRLYGISRWRGRRLDVSSRIRG